MFAVWGLAGFYAALGPALFVALTGSTSVWESALGLFLFAGVASASTIVLHRASGRALTITGAATMLAGLAATIIAVELGSVPLYFLASAIVGVGFGAGFQGPIRTLVPLASPEERPGLLSAMFVVAFAVFVIADWHSYQSERQTIHLGAIGIGRFLISARLWFDVMQTWQAEFFAMAVFLVLSIFLRQENSAESKPVWARDDDTGETNE